MKNLTIKTGRLETLTDITDDVLQYITDERISTGFLIVQTPDNECSVLTLSNETPTIEKDFIKKLTNLFPVNEGWEFHGFQTNNLRSMIFGNSKTILIENGSLILGAYERIYLADFAGPSDNRLVLLQAFGEHMKPGEEASLPEVVAQYNASVKQKAADLKLEEERAIEEMRREYRESHPETQDPDASDSKD
ncbi:MAG: secondary thiamine-phosphate synthase enzyme YjbQ [Eubacteriaceae bacterium]|jgi:secondary thiamine-phosphate synthase enzyme